MITIVHDYNGTIDHASDTAPPLLLGPVKNEIHQPPDRCGTSQSNQCIGELHTFHILQ